MELGNLKITKDEYEQEDSGAIAVPEPEREEYPWGTRINLNDREIGKVPGTDGLRVGDALDLIAKGEVISMSQSANQKRKNQSLEIQITDLGLQKPKVKKDDLGTMMDDILEIEDSRRY